jgi:hypothetical protein
MPKYIPQRHALRPYLHERKACFSHEARSRDAIVIQQSQSPIRKEDGNIYKSGHKFVWVPVKRARPIPVKTSDDTDDIHDPKLEAYQSAEGVLNSTKISSDVGLGSVYREDAGTGKKCLDNTLAAFSSTSRKNESASMQIDSAMGGSTSGTSMRLQRMGCFKYSTSISTQHGDSSNRDNQKGKSGSICDQKRVFSAKQIIFSPRTTVRQYRPRNLGGNKIKSVAPGTKPGPQWCPNRLIHTQKRCVKRLRASEIREEIAKKKSNKWFNKHRPMVPPKMTWKKKCIVTEENINAHDMVVDGVSENTRDASSDMDIDKGG